MGKNLNCPVCQSEKFEELTDFDVIPRSGSFLPDREASFYKESHSLDFCSHCALIKRRLNSEGPLDYQHVNRVTREQMPAYVPEIIRILSNRYHESEGLIMDVGGNDGAFLDMVAQAGYPNCLNIEPSVALAEACLETGHKVENVHLDLKVAKRIRNCYGPAGVIFCRHVLEHVPDPFGLLSAMRTMLKNDGYLFVETPDAKGIIHGLLGHELWDEHLFHFTSENLSLLLMRSGFRVDWRSVKPHRGGTNILFWAKPSLINSPLAPCENEAESDVKACRRFNERWADLRSRIQEEVENWPNPIICLGASHPQSSYLLFTGIGHHVDFLVDDDQMKVGSFVPVPQPVPVISTDQLLKGSPPGTVIRSAFGCDSWMDYVCTPLAEKGVSIVEPYPNKICKGYKK